VAGISEDFRFYPVPYWWEEDGSVWMWVELGSRLSGGPCELAVLNRVMFRDIHSRDAGLERSDISESAPPPELAGAGQDESIGASLGWGGFEAVDREPRQPTQAADPWARMAETPEVEIDDD
jgi:hypothetical protein